MVLRRRFPTLLTLTALLLAGMTGARGAQAQDKPRPGEVSLPLKDYLLLVDTAERIQKEKAKEAAEREAPVSEVVAQRVWLVIGKDDAEVAAEFDVLVLGAPVKPVLLPLAGYPAQSAITTTAGGGTAGAAVTAVNGGGGVVLVAPAAGKYTVKVSGRAPLAGEAGIQRLPFAPVVAPVAATEVDLPADLAWSCPGAVVVEDQVQGGRRHVRLASRRGERQALELRRKVDSAEAEKLLAQTVVLTLFQLRPEGVRRHDVVLYDISRGSLGSFKVELPPGLEVDQAGTDEGVVVPVVERRTLTIHRQHQLQGSGYLVLTSTPAAETLAQGASLAAVQPGYDVRAHYLAISSAIASDARPLPETAWSRVDLSDLPAALSEALTALDLTAAWRWTGKTGDTAGARLAVATLPGVPGLDATISLRETTTLLTVDGTLLHRDRFTVESHGRSGASLDLVLPAGAILWSAKVDDQPVRPLERGGTLSVPLGFKSGAEAVVEVVAVLERAGSAGRSQLALELPQLRVPVLDHRWRLLLPEGPRYRFHTGALRPARPEKITFRGGAPRVEADGVEGGVVGGTPGAPVPEPVESAAIAAATAESPMLDEKRNEKKAGRRDKSKDEELAASNRAAYSQEVKGLEQGLVGGVKPLPITIPESGKVLLLTGVLPPARVAVELEVKAKGKW